MQRLTLAAAVAALTVAASSAALAIPMSNLPPEETQGVVTYRTGGIGHEEAMAMKKAEAHYPLSLEFAARSEPHNRFLANVEVTITDQHGKTALKTYSDGPLLLASLPDGRYTVVATDDGKTETRQVNVASGKPEHLVFIW